MSNDNFDELKALNFGFEEESCTFSRDSGLSFKPEKMYKEPNTTDPGKCLRGIIETLSRRNILDFKYGDSKGRKRLKQYLRSVAYREWKHHWACRHNPLIQYFDILKCYNKQSINEQIDDMFFNTRFQKAFDSYDISTVKERLIEKLFPNSSVDKSTIHVLSIPKINKLRATLEMCMVITKLLRGLEYKSRCPLYLHNETDSPRKHVWEEGLGDNLGSHTMANYYFSEYIHNLTGIDPHSSDAEKLKDKDTILSVIPKDLVAALETYSETVYNPNPNIQKAVEEKRAIWSSLCEDYDGILNDLLDDNLINTYADRNLNKSNHIGRLLSCTDNFVYKSLSRYNDNSNDDYMVLFEKNLQNNHKRTAERMKKLLPGVKCFVKSLSDENGYNDHLYQTISILEDEGDKIEKFYRDCRELLTNILMRYNKNLIESILCQLLYNRGEISIESPLSADSMINDKMTQCLKAISNAGKRILQDIMHIDEDTLQSLSTNDIIEIIDNVVATERDSISYILCDALEQMI